MQIKGVRVNKGVQMKMAGGYFMAREDSPEEKRSQNLCLKLVLLSEEGKMVHKRMLADTEWNV